MPVQPDRVRDGAALLHRRRAQLVQLTCVFERTPQQITETEDAAEQVYAMQPRQQIEEGTERVGREIDALRHELPPCKQLRSEKAAAERQRDGEPNSIDRIVATTL